MRASNCLWGLISRLFLFSAQILEKNGDAEINHDTVLPEPKLRSYVLVLFISAGNNHSLYEYCCVLTS